MEEFIDDEPCEDESQEIADDDLWEAFAGCKPSGVIRDPTGKPVLVKRNEIEAIRNVVAVPPLHGDYSTYLLRLMWIRECKFGKLPLKEKEVPFFFRSVFALGGADADIQSIWYKLNGLKYRGYVQSRGGLYILAESEKINAEEWFDDLVLESEYSKEGTEPTSPRATDSVPDDPPPVLMAATGKGNRKTIPLEVVGETAPIDPADESAAVIIQGVQKGVMADEICAGILKAEVLKNTPKKMKKERDVFLHDQFGMTATEIARLDGATDNSVRKTSQNIQKSLDRKK